MTSRSEGEIVTTCDVREEG